MDVLINFFTLQPTFTLLGLRIAWYIYLFNVVMQSYVSVAGIFQALAQRGISWEAWSPNIFPLVLGVVAQLVVVRLLMEVAATILLSRAPSNR
jgi:hypothetical protein